MQIILYTDYTVERNAAFICTGVLHWASTNTLSVEELFKMFVQNVSALRRQLSWKKGPLCFQCRHLAFYMRHTEVWWSLVPYWASRQSQGRWIPRLAACWTTRKSCAGEFLYMKQNGEKRWIILRLFRSVWLAFYLALPCYVPVFLISLSLSLSLSDLFEVYLLQPVAGFPCCDVS